MTLVYKQLCCANLASLLDVIDRERLVPCLACLRLFFVLFLNKIPQIVTNFLVSAAQDGKVSVHRYVV